MHLNHYRLYTTIDFRDYEFYSKGPRGNIKKAVRFTKIREDEPAVYNLGFGDMDEETGNVCDLSVSNNQDTKTVLASVAFAALQFSYHFNNPYIYAEGSTPARTRLYQMGISNMWESIREIFDIYGAREGYWERFRKGVNYSAFLVKRK